MVKKKKDRYMDTFTLIMLVMGIVALAITVVNFTVVRTSLSSYGKKEMEKEINKYNNHYVLIYNDNDTQLWQEIYESANSYARSKESYVELMGANLGKEYSKCELMEMAILAGVDGIIVQGDETVELQNMIRKAREAQIPVVTVMSDASESERNSYVGISSYDIGIELGNQAIEMIDEGKKMITDIMILMSTEDAQSSQHNMYVAFIERISDVYHFNIEVNVVDNTTPFSTDEGIRDILLGMNNDPDIMVCLSDEITKSAYQGLIEYNKAHAIYLTGVGSTDEIFVAIQKGVVRSAISVDKVSMGANCVKALLEYEEMGYVSEFIRVDSKLVNKENVGELTHAKNK